MNTMYNFSGIISVEYHHRGTGSQSPDDRWLFAHKLIPETHLSRAWPGGPNNRAKHHPPSVHRINTHSSLSLTIINNNKLYKNSLLFILLYWFSKRSKFSALIYKKRWYIVDTVLKFYISVDISINEHQQSIDFISHYTSTENDPHSHLRLANPRIRTRCEHSHIFLREYIKHLRKNKRYNLLKNKNKTYMQYSLIAK